jgi:putative FmdB family regulatory protein
MPTYDYKCTSCGHNQEVFLSMSNAINRILKKCTNCTNNILEKQVASTPPTVEYRGSGFYTTDYKNKKDS